MQFNTLHYVQSLKVERGGWCYIIVLWESGFLLKLNARSAIIRRNGNVII